MEELSNEEIAVHLDLPLNTVKTRIRRARDLLLAIVKRQK
jgi:DNA-directed RNA polymerase specialized sigma24 family protein